MTLPSARRLAERTHASWSRMSNGDCTMFWCAERNQLRDGHHLHALVRLPDEFHQPHLHRALCESYQVMTGAKVETLDRGTGKAKFTRWSRIDLRKFDPKRNASGYLSKYLLKDGGLDWDIH